MKKFKFRMSNVKDTVIEYFVTGELSQFEKFFQEAISIAATAKGAWIAYIEITDADASQVEVK